MIDRNHRYWSRPQIASQYREQSGLTAPEEAFVRSVPALGSARVLDIGVGGGRTASAVSELAGSYIGIDYSEPLIAACRARFAGTTLADAFRVADARDLSEFDPGAFDVVMFGSNSIDYVGHADRGRILTEVARVLRPGGRLGISSHNVNALPRVLSLGERLERLARDRSPARLPLAAARHLPRRAASIVRNPAARRLVNRPWVLLKDDTMLIRPTVTYYVAPREMERQLASAGFGLVEVLNPDGAPLSDGWAAAADAWLFWSVRRDDAA